MLTEVLRKAFQIGKNCFSRPRISTGTIFSKFNKEAKNLSEEILKQKEAIVKDIEDKVNRSKSIVIVDYRGINVEQDTQMRTELRKSGVEYKVLKNHLVFRAFKNAGYDGFEEILKGPTAVAFSYDDAVAPAKIIGDYVKKVNKIAIKGGIVEGKQMSTDDIAKLATIPSKNVLVAQLLGLLTSPMRGLAVAINEVAKKNA